MESLPRKWPLKCCVCIIKGEASDSTYKVILITLLV